MKKKNVLIVGNAGREHALAWKISQSPYLGKLFVAPGNGGTGQIAENIVIAKENIKELTKFAKNNEIDLTIVGPNLPLSIGIVDEFRKQGLKIFGPTKAASKLEYSKHFGKTLMIEENIPTASFKSFTKYRNAILYSREQNFPLVIKANGLALGQGAYICKSMPEAETALHKLMVERIHGAAGDEIIIEEFLEGPEISVHALCDEKDYLLFPPSQDHKSVFAHGVGPNTGGMGSYAPVSWATPAQIELIKKSIIEPTLKGMKKRGIPFTGCLYAGIKITSDGPKVLEFNVRFGDPEMQSYLRLLDNDLLEVFDACVRGRISKLRLSWKKLYAVCVVISTKGYPGKFRVNDIIEGIDKAEKIPDVIVFHAGTKRKGNDFYTADGRVLGVSAVDKDLAKAIEKSYRAVKAIKFDGAYFRADIGESSKALEDMKPRMLDRVLKLIKGNF